MQFIRENWLALAMIVYMAIATAGIVVAVNQAVGYRDDAREWQAATERYRGYYVTERDVNYQQNDRYEALRGAAALHCVEAARRELGFDVWPVDEMHYQINRCFDLINEQAAKILARSE